MTTGGYCHASSSVIALDVIVVQVDDKTGESILYVVSWARRTVVLATVLDCSCMIVPQGLLSWCCERKVNACRLFFCAAPTGQRHRMRRNDRPARLLQYAELARAQADLAQRRCCLASLLTRQNHHQYPNLRQVRNRAASKLQYSTPWLSASQRPSA